MINLGFSFSCLRVFSQLTLRGIWHCTNLKLEGNSGVEPQSDNVDVNVDVTIRSFTPRIYCWNETEVSLCLSLPLPLSFTSRPAFFICFPWRSFRDRCSWDTEQTQRQQQGSPAISIDTLCFCFVRWHRLAETGKVWNPNIQTVCSIRNLPTFCNTSITQWIG